MSETIQRLRDEITELSLKLLSHINQRTERVPEYSKRSEIDLPTTDPHRESLLMDLLVTKQSGPMTDASVRKSVPAHL